MRHAPEAGSLARMGVVTACWIPLWYNLDEGFAVGETAELGFWNDKPPT